MPRTHPTYVPSNRPAHATVLMHACLSIRQAHKLRYAMPAPTWCPRRADDVYQVCLHRRGTRAAAACHSHARTYTQASAGRACWLACHSVLGGCSKDRLLPRLSMRAGRTCHKYKPYALQHRLRIQSRIQRPPAIWMRTNIMHAHWMACGWCNQCHVCINDRARQQQPGQGD